MKKHLLRIITTALMICVLTGCNFSKENGDLQTEEEIEEDLTDLEKLINEAKSLSLNFKEIVLTGIHTAGYGLDLKDYNFVDLLKDMLKEVPYLRRIRISSIEITELDVALGTWQNVLDGSDENLKKQGVFFYNIINGVLEKIDELKDSVGIKHSIKDEIPITNNIL